MDMSDVHGVCAVRFGIQAGCCVVDTVSQSSRDLVKVDGSGASKGIIRPRHQVPPTAIVHECLERTCGKRHGECIQSRGVGTMN